MFPVSPSFRRSRLYSAVLAVTIALGAAWLGAGPHASAAKSIQMTIHYFRYDGDYSGWDIWGWDVNGLSGAGYPFNGSDSFGQVATASVPCTSCTQLGFIVRFGGDQWVNREPSTAGNGNRFVTVTHGKAEAWVVTGDPNTYTTLKAAEAAKAFSIKSAYLDGPKTVDFSVNKAVTLGASGGGGYRVLDKTTGSTIKATRFFDGHNVPGLAPRVAGDFQKRLGDPRNWDSLSTRTLMRQVSGDLYQKTLNIPAGTWHYQIAMPKWTASYPSAAVTLTQLSAGPVTFSYVPWGNQVFDDVDNSGQPLPPNDPGWKSDVVGLTLAQAPNLRDRLVVTGPNLKAFPVTPRNVLNGSAYYYSGTLGALYSKASTTFRLWAPTASHVSLQLFRTETGPAYKTVPLSPGPHGVMQTTVSGDLSKVYYLYRLTIAGSTITAIDPYAFDTSPNGGRGLVVNLTATNPAGWSSDQHVHGRNQVDASVYETSVRDFSIDPNSGMKHRGKYLAFTETGTTTTSGGKTVSTGIDSLKQLGVKDVELMPTYESSSIDETKASDYNWGYDPRNYDTPEGQYATTPHGTARITQFKRMVRAIHRAGMGVILDSVYNHVGDTSVFNDVVPQYYFRTDDYGSYFNGSGEGNEVATERPMVFKFVEDSMRYWLREYHVDGFRMDQMPLFGRTQLHRLVQDLRKVDSGVIVFGEPYQYPQSGLPLNQQPYMGNGAGLGAGFFNTDFRTAICCSVYSDSAVGFATGGPGSAPNIKQGVVGSISYSHAIHAFASQPAESINYVSAHDHQTLWDRITDSSNPGASRSSQIAMDELAQAVVFTAQGIPFMQSGEEMLRTKQGNGNSYNAGDAVNELDWSRKARYPAVFRYYAGLNKLRDAHRALRMPTSAEIRKHLSFLRSPNNTVAFELAGHANGDPWKNIVVVYNPNASAKTVPLPSGAWTVVGDHGAVGTTAMGTAHATVSVAPISTEVLYQP